MVFSTTNLFKSIPCPEGEKCLVTNCIYGHELAPKQLAQLPSTSTNAFQDSEALSEPAPKRRKVTSEEAVNEPASRADKIRSELAVARQQASNATSNPPPHTRSDRTTLPSLAKSVSPPPTSGKSISNLPSIGESKQRQHGNAVVAKAPAETLNPRLIPNDPVGHPKRALYLKHIHAELTRLNNEAADSEDPQAMMLTPNDLIVMALEEEETVVKDKPLIYPNIVKNRLARYKKMKAPEWISYVATLKQPTVPTKVDKPINTGLTEEEELLLLPHLAADQGKLAPYGYIPVPPTQEAADEAAAAVQASKNYEVCDRCSARFQVFPGRSETGSLTSNGPCQHHPNRKVFPPKTKGDIAQGANKEPFYPCCGSALGQPGCTKTDNHVFKSSSPARLAAVLPFINTPDNAEPEKGPNDKEVKAVSFDCEMGYTTYGLELIRLTAVTWPQGSELLDVLVRPVGTIIDLNSRFSGVWPEQFTNAPPYSTAASTNVTKTSSPLPIVSSPSAARSLLLSYLTPSTPLLGHAIENDLNALRLCHPAIVDTVVLYPHNRGLPMRFGLKALTAQYLDRRIQTGGDRGHDSLEDARATGDLVRWKVGERWKILRGKGWKIEGGSLIAPGDEDAKRDVADMMSEIFQGADGTGRRKRKRATSEQNTDDEKTSIGHAVAE